MRWTAITLIVFTTVVSAGVAIADNQADKSCIQVSLTVENCDEQPAAECGYDQTRSKDAAKVADPPARKPEQRPSIAPQLLAAAETIRKLNQYPIDKSSKKLIAAIRLLEQSTDSEAANSLALQLANHQVATGINNVRFVGFHILASRDRKSTLKFLESRADRLPEKERKRVRELHRAVTRRVIAPRAGGRRPPMPAPPVADKTRVRVAMAFGKPIYRDQIEPGKSLAKTQNAAQRRAHRGRRLLQVISRQATEDYRRRNQLEVTAEMKKSLWEAVMRAPLPPDRSVFCEEEQRLISFGWQHASLMDWVLAKSLYERYGGRVGMGSLGLWLAADGRNQLIRDYQKSGHIRIDDAEVEKAFWKEATKPNFADAYPKGERLKRLLAHPPHLGNGR